MHPIDFPQANMTFGPPPDLQESQCQSVRAFRGNVESGSIEGSPMVVVAWQLTEEECEKLRRDRTIFLSMLFDGLVPHMLSLDFHTATHPA